MRARLLVLAIATVACTSFQPVTMVVPGTIDVADEIRVTKLDGTEIRLTDPRMVDDTVFGRPREAHGGWSKDTVSIPVDGVAEILTSQPDRTKQTRFAILVGVLSVVAALFLVTKVLPLSRNKLIPPRTLSVLGRPSVSCIVAAATVQRRARRPCFPKRTSARADPTGIWPYSRGAVRAGRRGAERVLLRTSWRGHHQRTRRLVQSGGCNLPSDLRELNELNFARFDAKLEQRLSRLNAKWDVRFARRAAHVEQRISTMGERITAVGVEVRKDIDALWIELRDRESRILPWGRPRG